MCFFFLFEDIIFQNTLTENIRDVCDSHQVLTVWLSMKSCMFPRETIKAGIIQVKTIFNRVLICLPSFCIHRRWTSHCKVVRLPQSTVLAYGLFESKNAALSVTRVCNCTRPSSLSPGQNVIKTSENLVTEIICSLSSQPLYKVAY